jgi:hypothetical protein
MHPTERCYYGNGKGQELTNLHRFAEMPIERLATRILEEQYCPIAIANEFQGPGRPITLQMVLQSVFMRKTFDTARSQALCGQP